MSRSDTATGNPTRAHSAPQDDSGSSGAVQAGGATVGLEAPVTAKTDAGNKEIQYRSKRAELKLCMTPPTKDNPGHFINFSNHSYTAKDKAEAEFLDKTAKSRHMVAQEFFRLPDVDVMLLSGDLAARLDQMLLPELRHECRERGIDYQPIDDENSLRYKLLKRLALNDTQSK